MQDTEEIWKDVVGYEGLYKVSSIGRVKSLKRLDSQGRPIIERILRPQKRQGYSAVNLCKEGVVKMVDIHRIEVHAFYGFCPDSVDHINEIKNDNRIENLNPVTQRENCHRYRKRRRDLPLGVCKTKHPGRTKKYIASITVSGKTINLGFHYTIEEASEAFQNKLRTLAK